MKVEENLTSEIMCRTSRRKFTEEEVSIEEEVKIVEILDRINEVRGLSFKVVANYGGEIFNGFSSYGLIRGCNSYIALIGETKDQKIEEKIGYFGEYLVLKLVQMGFGTCWIGATYDHKEIFEEISLDHGEKIYCLIAFGKIESEEKDGFEKLISMIGKRRKSIGDLFSNIDKIDETKKDWIIRGMEFVQKAPSAKNKQPWIFRENDGDVIINSKENDGYEKIDMGIAMLHFEQGAKDAGCEGEWKKRNGVWKFLVGEEDEDTQI